MRRSCPAPISSRATRVELGTPPRKLVRGSPSWRARAWRDCCGAIVLTTLLPGLCGCGETFGGLLYHFNLLQWSKIPAQFELSAGPLLIIVDDDWEFLTWPAGRDYLADQIARHLRDAKAAGQLIPTGAVKALRRTDPQFQQRSISEVGAKLGASQVLWLQIREFVATTEIDTVSGAARCRVRVKVFDPQARSKAEMRLWPAGREGEVVSTNKSAAELIKFDNEEDIARTLLTETADNVAKLFYRHRPRD